MPNIPEDRNYIGARIIWLQEQRQICWSDQALQTIDEELNDEELKLKELDQTMLNDIESLEKVTPKCICGHRQTAHQGNQNALNSPCQTSNCKCQIFNEASKDFPKIPVKSNSGNILAVGFNPATDTMIVDFKSGVSYWYYIAGMRDQYAEFEKTFDDPQASTGSYFAKVFRNIPFFGKVDILAEVSNQKVITEEKADGSKTENQT